jgi:DNA-binding LytR/AlgR family response regulator
MSNYTAVRKLRVLAIDDEAPALADLVFELRTFDVIESVTEATDANAALRALRDATFDAVFLDIRMPGLDGLELARVLQQFKVPPPIVFVTAHEAHAVEAFEVRAIDYVLKPVRHERIERALARIAAGSLEGSVVEAAQPRTTSTSPITPTSPITASRVANVSQPGRGRDGGIDQSPEDRTISVETGGRIRFIDRRDVQFVAASGDYVRLHIADANFLYRAALSALEERWSDFGFVRVHRSYLVSLAHIDEVRIEPGRGYVIRIGERVLPVSRRLSTNLRSRLFTHASEQQRP